MKLYSLEAVENLAEKYQNKGGEVAIIHEGVLLDDMVMFGEGLKTTVATSIFLNAWSSAYSVRHYNKMPKKYAVLLEKMAMI